MAKQNTLPKSSKHVQNAFNKQSLDELRAIQKTKKDCSKRVEELKYKLFQIADKHMSQTIIVIRKWIKD